MTSKCCILSLNVNGILNKKKYGALIRWLASFSPQVLFLQETHLKTNFPGLFLPRWYSHAFFASAGLAKRGVALYFCRGLPWEFGQILRDPNGRWIWVEAKLNDTRLYFINYYGPIVDDITALLKISDILRGLPGKVILGGDFNFIQDLKKDTSNKNKKELKPKTKKVIEILRQEHILIDPWRDANPSKLEFTCYSNQFHTASRIDFFLISQSLGYMTSDIDINPFSDHSLIKLEVEIGMCRRPRSRWQMDRLLLQDLQWVADIKEWIVEFFKINENTAEIFSVWGGFKAALCGQMIALSAFQIKYRKEKIFKLQQAVVETTKLRSTQPIGGDAKAQIDRAKYELKEFFMLEEIASSRTYLQRVYEESQMVGKMLAGTTKTKQEAAMITEIIDPKTRTSLTDKEEIAQVFLEHYSQLYTTRYEVVANQIINYFEEVNLPILSGPMMNQLQLDISEEEIINVIKSIAGAKACGVDGLPIEFYKTFFKELTPFLAKLFNNIKQGGSVPPSFKESILVSFVKKGKNGKDVNSYRPISLLNTDFKILMKIWAQRFTPIAQGLIHHDQTGFVAGRSMSTNTGFLIQALDYATNNKIPILITSVDAEKAFDLVNWDTLFFGLGKFGFPVPVVNMLKNIYQGAHARVIVNGNSIGLVEINRGTRQGCPLSPLLFTFFIEPLAIRIRGNSLIKAPIEGMTKLKLFADDIIMYLCPEKQTVEEALLEFSKFEQIGGYKINQGKTGVLILNRDCNFLPTNLRTQALKEEPIRYLGIFVSNHIEQLFSLNYMAMRNKIKTLLDKWTRLPLTLIGRVALLKMSILPLLIFLFINVPLKIYSKFFKDIDSMFREFIWNKKASRVKLPILQLEINQGGLALPNIQIYYEAAILDLTARLLEPNDRIDTYFLEKMICESGTQIPTFLKTSKLPKKSRYKTIRDYSDRLQSFFKQVNSSGFVFLKLEECRVFGLQIHSSHLKRWKDSGFKDLGHFLIANVVISWDEVLSRIGNRIKPGFLEYLQIVNFIKKYNILTSGVSIDQVNALYKAKLKGVGNWYSLLIKRRAFPLVDEFLGKITRETNCSFSHQEWQILAQVGSKALRAANFKRMAFLSRWLAYYTPKKLNKRHAEVDNKCFRCQSQGEGDWLHIFFTCPKLEAFWSNIFLAISQAIKKKIDPETEVALFGFSKVRSDLTKAEEACITICSIIARSLILQNWRSEEIPSYSKWINKMLRIRKFEEAYAKRAGAIKKFTAIWKFFDNSDVLMEI